MKGVVNLEIVFARQCCQADSSGHNDESLSMLLEAVNVEVGRVLIYLLQSEFLLRLASLRLMR
jgi:uncharacterized protein (DUF2344 family)